MTEPNVDAMDVLDYDPKTNPETGREELANPERGCGFLKEEKAYIRTDPVRSSDGEIPAFVTFTPPIPYKEGTLRSYQQFDGLGFQRSLKDDFSTVPEDDLSDLWDRYENSEDGEHWGAITTAYSQDLLMWVGETYYDDPRDFVEESRKFGLNKAIPVSKRQEPPAINPMRTRVFCIHPTAYRVYEQPVTEENDDGEQVAVEAEDGDVKTEKVRVSYREDDNRLGEDDAEDPVKTIAGVVGYSYLTRVVWTAPSDGDIPKWAKQYEDTGQLDIVDVGDKVPEDEVADRLTTVDDPADHEDPDVLRAINDALTGPDPEELTMDDPADPDDTEAADDPPDAADGDADTVVPSDKDGRDVEAADDDELTVDDLPSDYNERKRMAAEVGAEVSAQPSGEELNEAILDAVNGGDD